MIITGYAATPDVPLNGMILARGAIDCSTLVPLHYHHNRKIGEVIGLQYHGDNLLVTCETNDPVGRTAGFMSPTVRVLAHSNGKVTAARLIEVSLTANPVNQHCRVIERRDRDHLRDYFGAQARFYSTMLEFTTCIRKFVEAAIIVPPGPPPRREMTQQDRLRLERIHERAAARQYRNADLGAPTSSFSSLAQQLNSRLEA